MFRRWPAIRHYLSTQRRAGQALLGRLSIRVLPTLLAAVAVGLGVLVATTLGGWLAVVGDLAVNVAAAALVAGAAIASLLYSTRSQALRRLLEVQRQEAAQATDVRLPGHPNQAWAMAGMLTDRPHSPGCLMVEAALGSNRKGLLADLLTVLTKHGMVAVRLADQALPDGGMATAVAEQFRQMLTVAGAVEAPLVRTLEQLAKRRRLVVVIDGMDESDRPLSRRSTIEMVRGRVLALRAAELPFIGFVEPGATPPELTPFRLSLPTVGGRTIIAFTASGETPHRPERRQLAAARRLAAALRDRELHVETIEGAIALPAARVAGGAAVTQRLDHLSLTLSRRGPLAFLAQPLWQLGLLTDAGMSASLPSGRRRRTWRKGRTRAEPLAARGALLRIGQQLLLHDTKTLNLTTLMAASSPVEAGELVVGIGELERLGVADRRHRGDRVLVRFAEPELRELIVGVCAAAAGLPFGHTYARSRTAFTGEVLQRVVLAGRRTRREWERVLAFTAERGALVSVGDVWAALTQQANGPYDPPVDWLQQTWRRADDRERLTFVRRLPAQTPDHYTTFLWSLLVQPAFARTSHSVRRAVARHLGSAGLYTWPVLAPEWERLTAQARRPGLAWYETRDPVYLEHGSAIASMCWGLPSVALTSAAPEASRLIRELATAVIPGGGPERDGAPDIGIEISLAEGCKDMAYLSLVHELPIPAVAAAILGALARSGRSWVTRLLALQASALAAAADQAWLEDALTLCREAQDNKWEHALVRRYATTLSTVVGGDPASLPTAIFTVVWSDDTDALEEAGGVLTLHAARTLAVVTLLLNLVEARVRSEGDWLADKRSQVTALVERALPGCLENQLLARAYGRVACSCEMKLCGMDLNPLTMRPMSSVFAYRCLSRPAERDERVERLRRASAEHLRRLARISLTPIQAQNPFRGE